MYINYARRARLPTVAQRERFDSSGSSAYICHYSSSTIAITKVRGVPNYPLCSSFVQPSCLYSSRRYHAFKSIEFAEVVSL